MGGEPGVAEHAAPGSRRCWARTVWVGAPWPLQPASQPTVPIPPLQVAATYVEGYPNLQRTLVEAELLAGELTLAQEHQRLFGLEGKVHRLPASPRPRDAASSLLTCCRSRSACLRVRGSPRSSVLPHPLRPPAV